MANDKLTQGNLNLRSHQEELLQLSELAGIHADPTLLKIIIDLLNMQIPPYAIYEMIKTIKSSKRSTSVTNQSYSSNSS